MRLSADIMPLLLLANGLGSVAGGIAGGQITDRLGPYRTFVAADAVALLTLVAISIAAAGCPICSIGPLWLLLFGLAGFLRLGDVCSADGHPCGAGAARRAPRGVAEA